MTLRAAAESGTRIRVCFLIGTLDRGGAEGQLVHLVTRLDRARFEPFVCCLSRDGPHRAAIEASGVPVHVVGLTRLRGIRATFALPGRLLGLLRAVRRFRPDIVHGFLFWAYIFGALSARLTGVQVVVASRRSLGFFKQDKPLWLWLERRANRSTDLLVANSEAVRQDAIRQERVPPGKIAVIYNGVEVADRDERHLERLRASLDLSGRGPIITVVANFRPYKAHDILFDALPAIAAEFPQTAVLLVGDGVLRAEYEERARVMGLSAVVRFLGGRPDAADLMALADVVLHPSDTEGFSNAVLEAMAAGRPVIASAVGGNPEAIVDGETGLLTPPRDAAALAEATLSLLRHPDEARRMGTAGRDRARVRFATDRMVAEYERLYERLLGDRSCAA